MNPDIRIGNEPSFDWQNTALHLAMKEVIDAGLYDPSGYAPDWNTDPEKAAVAYTEYTYLVNWSMWNMSVYWDGGSLSPEWDDSLKTPAGMLANNPLGYALFNTYFAPVLSKPNFATIESIFGENDTGVSGYVPTSVGVPTTGIFRIPTNLKSYGDIHATGDITFDGNILISGDNSSEDTISIGGEVDSDLVPDQTLTYDLGSDSQRWGHLYTGAMNDLNDVAIQGDLSFNGIAVNLGIVNKWYVSANGLDTSPGDHPNFAFATVKRAIQEIEASTAGPHQIHILAGDYEEEFPLEVPPFTSIKGAGIRSVTIRPTVATQSKDAFLLNDSSLVCDLTIKDFYYDAINNTGHAFRFAPNANIVGKSPYVQNLTVITKGSTITEDDPRGFDAGDAGRGAFLDGSEVDPSSYSASMLFNAVTFIVPGVDAVTLTNGVRAEYIDCFTYFANRSIYATQGSLGFAGAGQTFGAEVRAIGSASVYGNQGAVGDGADVIMYLISHNFAYIGVGKDVTNDVSLVNQFDEVLESNNAKIHYVSQDQGSDFRVGDNFYVDASKGTTSIDVTAFDLSGSSLTIGRNNITFIDATKIETGNFRITNNTIQSFVNEVNVSSASGQINLTGNVQMNNNLSVQDDVTIGGSLITFGNEVGDTVDFSSDIDQTLLPSRDGVGNLGTDTYQWKKLLNTRSVIEDVTLHNNVITSNVTNQDLVLQAQGTGFVKIADLNFKTDISSTSDVAVNSNANTTIINSNGALELPVGTTAQDPAVTRGFRFDTTSGNFIATSPGPRILNGVTDFDKNTYISTASNQYTFFAGGIPTGEIRGDGTLEAIAVSSQDQTKLDGNSITVGSQGGQGGVVANGAGRVLFDTSDFEIGGSDWYVTSTNSDLDFAFNGQVRNTYLHFDTTKAAIMPYGAQVVRPVNARQGELWWNQDNSTLEVYTGTEWVASVGTQEITVTEQFAEELNVIYELILS
jgi:hypothetical protein